MPLISSPVAQVTSIDSRKPYGIVYLFRNWTDGMVYVGQTRQGIRKRFRQHSWVNKKRKTPFEEACSANPNDFAGYTLAIAYSPRELNDLETHYISMHNATDPEVGYNRFEGGSRSPRHPLSRAKLSQTRKHKFATDPSFVAKYRRAWTAQRGKKLGPFSKEHSERIAKSLRGRSKSDAHRLKLKGRTVSPETREKLRIAHTGKVPSPETLAKRSMALRNKPKPTGFGDKIRAALSGRKRDPETIEKVRTSLIGRKMSAEAKMKMSIAHKGKPKSPEHAKKLTDNLQRYWSERRAREAAN